MCSALTERLSSEKTSARTYRIAGHVIRVVLEAPWTFRILTPREESALEILRAGGDAGVFPVPADRQEELALNEDRIGKRRLSRAEWDALSPEEQFSRRHSLDFFQYAPFEIHPSQVATDPASQDIATAPASQKIIFSDGAEKTDPALFEFTLHEGIPEEIWKDREKWTRVTAVDEQLPYYYGYTLGEKTIYEFYPDEGVLAGIFVMNGDYSRGDYYSSEGMGPRTVLMQVNTSLMIQYTFATAGKDTLLLHASAIRLDGKANLFFGVSGTGKSTHSRLWLENIPGCDLLNDDNPVIRFSASGECVVYGSPWSGKTLCYRNVSAPVRALVRIERAPFNKAVRLEGLNAYASIVAAVSTIRWNSTVMSRLVPVVEKAAMGVPCFIMQCLPDPEAAKVCKDATFKTEN